MSATLCSARLRDGEGCRSVATDDGMCSYHARLREQIGTEPVEAGNYVKRRNGRLRVPVDAESKPLDQTSSALGSPGAVRPALAATAAEEVETIRRVLLEAATSSSRESWATCSCPECGKTFRQEIEVPDHGARIKAIETLLREGLGRVGEAEVEIPTLSTVADVQALSWTELNLVFATEFASSIHAVVADGDDAVRAELVKLEPESRAILARMLAEVA